VHVFKGQLLVDFRDYYASRNGEPMPTKKGITFTPETWQRLKMMIPQIDDALAKIDRHIRK